MSDVSDVVVELREMARDNGQPDCDLDTLRRAADEIEMLRGMLGDITRAAADKNGEIQMLKHRISQLTN